MRFELMLPYQIKEAIAKNIPIVLPIGVMEYHGEHMAVNQIAADGSFEPKFQNSATSLNDRK